MTEAEIDKVFEDAKHSLVLEGFRFTARDEQLIKAVYSGKLSPDHLVDDLTSEN